MRRGEVWWADLPAPIGKRPVVLLSRNEAYSVREQVTIAPVTTRIRGLAAEVALGPRDGLPKECVANLDSLTTVERAALRTRVTVLSRQKLKAVEKAIHFALGFSQ